MSDAYRDENDVPTLIASSNVDGKTPVRIYADPVTHRLLVDSASGTGTVTTVSVVTANGFAGTVATATTTPAITISTSINSPVIAGNGTAISAATTTGSGSTVVLGTSPTITTSLIMADSANIVINATTGTKIGTATTQKLAFYNSTPIVQPTGDVITALQNLGLGSSLTIAATTITSRTLWGQTYDGSANVTGSLTAVGNITGGASSMTITAGTGNSRTLTLQSTTSGGTATTFLTGNADQTVTFASGFTAAGASTIGTGNAFTTGTIELGNASDTTLARASGGQISVEGVQVDTISNTVTLTNKRITPRVLSAAAYTTDTGSSINGDTQDMFIVTAQTGALKFNNPSGTPTDGQKLIITVASSTTSARALTWDTAYGSTTVTLPTTTAATTATLSIGFIYSTSKSLWQVVAVA